MPIPDLATPANQLFHTLDESPQRKSAKILNIQVQEINLGSLGGGSMCVYLLLHTAHAL